MQIPIYSGGVATAPLPTPTAQADQSAGLGAKVIGESLSAVATQGQKIYLDARDKAEAVEVNDFLTRLHQQADFHLYDDEQGATRLKGKDAFGADTAAYDAIERVRQEGLSKLTSPRSRAAAEAKSQEMMLGWSRTLETHVGAQRQVAEADSIKGRMATTLNSLSQPEVFTDPAARTVLIQNVSDAISAFALSDDGGKADREAWEAEAYTTAISGVLVEQGATAAEELFNTVEPLLGVKGAKVKLAIAKQKDKEVAFVAVRTALSSAIDPETGFLDETKAEAAFAKQFGKFANLEQQQAAEAAFKGAKAQLKEVKESKMRETYNELLGAMLTGGWGSIRVGDLGEKYEYLKTHDAVRAGKLFDRNLRLLELQKKSKSEQDAAQALANALFRLAFQALPADQRKTVDVVELASEVPDGAVIQPDQKGIATVEADKRKEIDKKPPHQASVSEETLRARALATVEKQRLTKRQKQEVQSAITTAKEAWEIANPGKVLTDQIARDEIIDPVTNVYLKGGSTFLGAPKAVRTPGWKLKQGERKDDVDEDGYPVAPAPATPAAPKQAALPNGETPAAYAYRRAQEGADHATINAELVELTKGSN